MSLAGCAGSETKPVIAVPADVRSCFESEPYFIPDRTLTVGDVERGWGSDRARAAELKRCGQRLMEWKANAV